MLGIESRGRTITPVAVDGPAMTARSPPFAVCPAPGARILGWCAANSWTVSTRRLQLRPFSMRCDVRRKPFDRRGEHPCDWMICKAAAMPKLPTTRSSLVLRTDFSDDAVWEGVQAASTAPSSEGFVAGLSFVSDQQFAGLTAEQVAALPSDCYRDFVFLCDNLTMTDPEMQLVVVERRNEPVRWFRVVPTSMWSVENNLSIHNMDFTDFANSVDSEGVFRGFQ